jgi:hypothetical protein
VSRDYFLVTRDRPSTRAFIRTLTEAAGRTVDIDGDFGDPDDYLNISSDDILIEVEPPGHVEAIDLVDVVGSGVALPEPDEEGCLWYTAAVVPSAAASITADIIFDTFRRLAETYHGVAIDAQTHP